MGRALGIDLGLQPLAQHLLGHEFGFELGGALAGGLELVLQFAISVRQARDLLSRWVAQGWLEVADPSRRGRKYRLADRYHELLE